MAIVSIDDKNDDDDDDGDWPFNRFNVDEVEVEPAVPPFPPTNFGTKIGGNSGATIRW